MAIYIRYATRALKLKVNLDAARDRDIIATDLSALIIGAKGTGTYTLIFVFKDGSELELTNLEISDGQKYTWDIKNLRMTHTAQSGVTATFIGEQQVL